MNNDTNNQLLHDIAGVDSGVHLTNNQLLKMIAVSVIGGGEDAGTLNGEPGSYYLNRVNHTGLDQISDISGLQVVLDSLIPLTQKGAANGVAPLGPDSKVAPLYLNIPGAFSYKGDYDAATNTPTLTNGVGSNGDMYKAKTAGTPDFGAGPQTVNIGDHIVYDGTVWDIFGSSEAVASVNGKTGVVVLNATDVSALAELSAAGKTVAGWNEGGQYTNVGYDEAPGAFKLVMRGFDEFFTVKDATAAQHPVSKSQLDTGLASKADTAALTAHTSNTSNPHAVTKTQVGLSNVNNTSDADKPISDATQAALNAKADQSALAAHTGNTSNPHSVTKAQVGLGAVTNDAQVKASDKASESEAEGGTDDTKWMTPLKTAQAINALAHGDGDSSVQVMVLKADQSFTATETFAIVADLSQIVLQDDVTQVRMIEAELYVSGAFEAGIKFRLFNAIGMGSITYKGSAFMPANSGDNMVFTDYDETNGVNFDPDPDSIRKVTISVQVTSPPTGGSYGSLFFEAAQQSSNGNPVTIHAGSKVTSRLVSST